MGRNQNYASIKPTKVELKSFENEIKESIKDLDWALRCYSLVLRDLGLTDVQVVSKMREVFLQIVEEITA